MKLETAIFSVLATSVLFLEICRAAPNDKDSFETCSCSKCGGLNYEAVHIKYV